MLDGFVQLHPVVLSWSIWARLCYTFSVFGAATVLAACIGLPQDGKSASWGKLCKYEHCALPHAILASCISLGKGLVLLCSSLRKLALVWQVVGERSEEAATRMHLWLERTAFYKVPKSHQDEVADECLKPFEQVDYPSFHVCACQWSKCHNDRWQPLYHRVLVCGKMCTLSG